MDPAEPYTSISVLLGAEGDSYIGNIAGSPPPAARNGNLYTLEEEGEGEEEEGDTAAAVVTVSSSSSSSRAESAARALNDEHAVAYPSNILLSFPMHIRCVHYLP